MNYKKIAIFMGAAFVLYFLVSQPSYSYGLVRNGLAGVGDAAANLGAFVRRLVR